MEFFLKVKGNFLIFPNCRQGGGFSSYKMPKKSYEWFNFNWRLTSVFSSHHVPERGHQSFLKIKIHALLLLERKIYVCTFLVITRVVNHNSVIEKNAYR